MGNPVIIEAVRTPLGKRNGGLAGVHPGDRTRMALSDFDLYGAMATGTVIERL